MSELNTTNTARRKYLMMAVASQLTEMDIESADRDAVETLLEMMQSFIYELGQSARNYCELAGRTQPVIGDVVISLINMGISVRGLDTFAKRDGRQVLPQPQQAQAQKQPSILQAGQKNSHPSHIPNHLPQFPDPHAYIRTPTYKQPVTEYEAIREKAASQKRDVEKALTKFLAKTSEIHSLFDNEDNPMFPLIACKPSFPPYMQALNPTDQVFDFEELEYYYQVANRKEDIADTKQAAAAAAAAAAAEDDDDGDEVEMKKDEKENDSKQDQLESGSPEKNGEPVAGIAGGTTGSVTTAQINLTNNSPSIDNPYLRAATIPRKVKPDAV